MFCPFKDARLIMSSPDWRPCPNLSSNTCCCVFIIQTLVTVKRLCPFVLQIPVSALKCSDLLWPDRNRAGHRATLQIFAHTVAEPVFLFLGGCAMSSPFV